MRELESLASDEIPGKFQSIIAMLFHRHARQRCAVSPAGCGTVPVPAEDLAREDTRSTKEFTCSPAEFIRRWDGCATTLLLALLFLFTTTSTRGSVLLDDAWTDGSRAEQNLPVESAWYTSHNGTLSSSPGSITGTTADGSRTWWTYFTSNPSQPVQLNVGETLKVTLQFSASGINAQNSSRALRIGLFDFSGGTRRTSDGNSPSGSNVSGYLLNMNFGQTFGVNNPIEIRKRSNVGSGDLMGSSGDYTTLGSGGGSSGSPAFSDETQYTLELYVTREASSVRITNRLSSNGGWIVVTAQDIAAAGASFDAFAIRPSNGGQTAASFTFSRFRVERLDGEPVAPFFISIPEERTVHAGETALFTAMAYGTEPLAYQWYFQTNTLLEGATSPTLTITNAQSAQAGTYHVVVTNLVGATSSPPVMLIVDTNPIPPVMVSHPISRSVSVGATVMFSGSATGSPPILYSWAKGGQPIPGATNATLTLANVQLAHAGTYTLVASNAGGSVTSAPATLSVSWQKGLPWSAYDLVGFAEGATGGGVLADSHPAYRKVANAVEFRAALDDDSVRVIEIVNDLDLGWNEIPAGARTSPFRANTAASLHPALIASGVTLIDIQEKDGLTIFSTNGAAIRHAEFNIKRCNNVLVRNLRFDELWEWDEADKGDYDSKDWDFITIDMGSTRIWIDHCDFTKAYDGVIDIKGGSHDVTISWCRFLGDDGGSESFVRQQIEALELNSAAHPMYHFLRTSGFSMDDIVEIVRSQKKGHLVGANEFRPDNALLSVTLHHNYYKNFQDRVPRLRGGNAHDFNLWVDNSEALAAKRLRNARVAAWSPTTSSQWNSAGYKFDVTLNGAISTEGGAVLVEKSLIRDVLSPIRNNQTNPNNPDYTGKIFASDTVYILDDAKFRGDSDAPGSPLAPVPAPVIPFSWNGFTELPYTCTLDDPEQLPEILDGLAFSGAGAGKLTWAKTNWLVTSYPVEPPSGFSVWQGTHFTGEQITNAAISGLNATPANDGVPNLIKYSLGLDPWIPADQPLLALQPSDSTGGLEYRKPPRVNDVVYQVESAESLEDWSTDGVMYQMVGYDSDGREIWRATHVGGLAQTRFYRLKLIYLGP